MLTITRREFNQLEKQALAKQGKGKYMIKLNKNGNLARSGNWEEVNVRG